MSRHISRRERAAGRSPGPSPSGLPTQGDAALEARATAAEERSKAKHAAWVESQEALPARSRHFQRRPGLALLGLVSALTLPSRTQ